MPLCPAENELVELLEGALDPDRATSVREHIDTCSACHAAVAALARSISNDATTNDATTSGTRPALDSIFADRYHIERQIGEGAGGVVYEATDTQLQRRVALKLLRSSSRSAHLAAARLTRESRAMAKLRHPNVVTVYDAGSTAKHMWVAMEFIEGMNLRQWCAHRPREVGEVLTVFRQAGAGLRAAHRAGIVHRDFKPDNVLLDEAGHAFVGDFGLAAVVADEADGVADGSTQADTPPTLTRSGAVIGTPAYLSPEAWRGEPASAASDVFSFCVSLHEALYGRRPFAGGTVGALKTAVEANDVQLATRRGVPRSVQRCIDAGLSSNPDERPALSEVLALLQAGAWLRPAGLVVALGVVAGAASYVGLGLGGEEATARHPQCLEFGEQRRATDMLEMLELEAKAADERERARALRRTAKHGRTWLRARRDVCSAPAATDAQRRDIDLRLWCLERTWSALAIEAESLLESDTQTSIADGASDASICSSPDIAAMFPALDPEHPQRDKALWFELDAMARLQELGDNTQAIVGLQALVQRARTNDSPAVLATALARLGGSLQFTGQVELARATLLEAAQLAVANGQQAVALRTWTSLTYIAVEQTHDLDRAEEYVGYAYAASQHLPDIPRAAEHKLEIQYHDATLRIRQRRWDDAERVLEEGLAVAKATDSVMEPLFLDLRALLLSERGQLDAALTPARQALAMRLRTLDDAHPHIAFSHGLLAGILSEVGWDDAALVEAQAATRALIRAMGPRGPAISEAYLNEAHAFLALGRNEDAEDALDRSEAALDETERTDDWKASLVTGRFEIALAATDYDRAARLAAEFLAITRRLDPMATGAQWTARAFQALVAVEGGDPTHSREFAEAWVATSGRNDLAASDSAFVSQVAAEVFLGIGAFADAKAIGQRALARTPPMPDDQLGHFELVVAEAWHGLGDETASRRSFRDAAAHLRMHGTDEDVDADLAEVAAKIGIESDEETRPGYSTLR